MMVVRRLVARWYFTATVVINITLMQHIAVHLTGKATMQKVVI